MNPANTLNPLTHYIMAYMILQHQRQQQQLQQHQQLQQQQQLQPLPQLPQLPQAPPQQQIQQHQLTNEIHHQHQHHQAPQQQLHLRSLLQQLEKQRQEQHPFSQDFNHQTPQQQQLHPIARLQQLDNKTIGTTLSSNSSSSSQPQSNSNNHQNQTHHHQNGAGERLDNLKPAHSYIGLIGMCILSSPEKRMVLNDIYQFILDNYPYYRNRGSGWRNSVRHNLSLNECFQKSGRAANGKGHYWTIHPANMEDFMMGDFRRRRAQRKVRRWNNMDVPSDESDDESMEDATKPPLPEHFKRSLEMHRRLELSYQKSAEATSAAFAAVSAAAVAAAANGANQNPPSLMNPSPTGSCSPLYRKHELP